MKKAIFLLIIFLIGNASRGYASYVVIDAHTSRTLFASAPELSLPIASLTKMWTALVAIENSKLSDNVVISKKATLSEGSSIYLEEGEIVTVEYLLHGLLLRSGNDAAMALAEYVGGSEEGFVYLMNERAKLAGLQNTVFTNPSGLHNDKHLSTAYDTAKMLQVAMQNPTFKKVASSKSYVAKTTWQNKHKLLLRDVGAIAGKTGFTKVAGRTLATYFERDDKEFVVVTLNEPDDWNFHLHLANLVEENYKQYVVVKEGSYRSGKRVIKVDKDVKLLLTKKEYKEIAHTLYIPTNSIRSQGVWQVKLKSTPIYQFNVKLKQK